MADIDVERKDNNTDNNKNNNSKWWVLIVLVIIGIIVLWIAFSDRTNVDPEEEPENVGDSLQIRKPHPGSNETTALPFSKTGDQKELTNHLSKSKTKDHG